MTDLQVAASNLRAEIAAHANGRGTRTLPPYDACVQLMMKAHGLYRRQAAELLWPYVRTGQYPCCRL